MRPDAGTATVAGHDLLPTRTAYAASISLTGQYAAVDDKLTGEENLRMMARLLHLGRARRRDRAAELLAAFDLADAADRRVKTYSGGMRRRLDLAISMIDRPELLFLDEPTTGLDPRSREQLWAAVRDLADDGVTVLLTTQYLAEAEQLADQVALLHQGRIVAEGTAGQLKSGLGADEPGRGRSSRFTASATTAPPTPTRTAGHRRLRSRPRRLLTPTRRTPEVTRSTSLTTVLPHRRHRASRLMSPLTR